MVQRRRSGVAYSVTNPGGLPEPDTYDAHVETVQYGNGPHGKLVLMVRVPDGPPGDRLRSSVLRGVRAAGASPTGDALRSARRARDLEVDLMSCCDDPKPRISDATGRVFCGSCRLYLDARPQEASDTLSDEQSEETTDATSDEEGQPQ